MSVATLITKPNVSLSFLLELTAGLALQGWVLQTGSTYKFSTTLNVTAVKENGVALTSRASIALVDANPGSYYWDGSYVYVRATTGTIHDLNYLATVKFFFSEKPKVFNGQYYDPRLKDIPSLSLRIEPRFSGIGQIGTGSTSLLNGDRYFDSIEGINWDAGSAAFFIGVDQSDGTEMAYADYEEIGTWKVDRFDFTDRDFKLTLREEKSAVEKKIPFETYQKADYPNVEQGMVGKTIPLAYGYRYGVKPTLIDTIISEVANGTFELDSDADGYPNGWTFASTGGTGARIITDAPTISGVTNTASFRFTATSGNKGGTLTSAEFFNVTAKQAVTASFYFKSTVACLNTVQVIWYNKNKSQIATTSVYSASAIEAAWVQKTSSVTVPVNARFAKFKITGIDSTEASTRNALFDHVKFGEDGIVNRRYKVASHAIRSLEEVRKQENNTWKVIPFLDKDLDLAEFTIKGQDQPNNEPLAVDFQGKKNADGSLMINCADIVTDILAYVGITNLNTAAFAATKAYFQYGTDIDGIVATQLKPTLYIGGEGSTEEAKASIEAINAACGTFLFIDFSGQWYFKNFAPQQGSGLTTFDELDLKEFSKSTENKDVVSEVVVSFNERKQDKWSEVVTKERAQNQYLHAHTSGIVKEIKVALWDATDAAYFAERYLTTESVPLVKYQTQIPWQAFLKLPGDQVHIKYSNVGLDILAEILEVRLNITQRNVTWVLGDLRGWTDSSGFWVADTQAAWSAGDSAATKKTNRQNSGFWTGDDGLAISADGQSFKLSRTW